nr:hypothetical transcript [Hymenolepis microstoma]
MMKESSPIARRYDESDDEDGMRRYSNSDVEMASVHSAERSRDDGEEDENGEGPDMDVKTLKQLKGISEGARKKTVRRPMPKLDPLTLLGERGLPALLKEAEKTKFGGRGHEFDDLQKLMFIYESWANRMLPKFPFTEIMERLEVVGTKREVHNALQGMRAGTWPPTVSAEFVRDDSDDSDSENERPKAKNTLGGPLNDDEIEELLRMQDVVQENAIKTQPSPQPIASTSTAHLEEAEKEESAIERAERNRMAALARLEAKRQLLSTTPVRRAPTSFRNALKSMNSFDTSTQ